MALARVQYESDGSTTTYSIPFPYINRDDIKVSIDGTETEDFTFLDGSSIDLDTAPDQGLIIDIVRETEREDLLVEFNDGSTLLESDLTLAAQQSFYIAQEAFDQTGSTLAVADDGSYSASSRRISLLGYPTKEDDASTKSYVDDIFAQGENAYDMAVEAGNWANYPVDQLVPEGDEVDDYSALHHATKASQDAASASSDAAAASQDADDAAASASAASTSESNAAASESAAATSEANAATSETNAEDSASAASTSESNAATSESNAASSASSAATSETNAASSENQAQLWAEESEDVTVEPGSYSAKHHAIKASDSAASASSDASAASTSASNAATSESNAATSESNAATSESNADDYRTEAQNWANAAEDTLVPEGDGVDDYSALHWSKKAEGWASSLNLPSATGNGRKILRLKADESGHEYTHGGTHIQSDSAVTGSVTKDPNLIRHLKLTLTGDTTLSLSDMAVADESLIVHVEITQDATGGRTLTWGGTNIKFPGGVTPDVSSGAGVTDLFEFVWNGTSYIFRNYLGDIQ